MRSGTECPGCGVVLPAAPSASDPVPLNASGECAAVQAEVVGYEFQHPVMLRYHQLTVDTYAAQHAGGSTPVLRTGYALAGLWLALEHGFSGEDVRAVHRRMGRPTGAWPHFGAPDPDREWTTVLDVAEAGVRGQSEAGHARAATRWADEVWVAWLTDVPGTDDAVEHLLRGIFLEVGRAEGLHGTIGPASAVHRLLGLLQH